MKIRIEEFRKQTAEEDEQRKIEKEKRLEKERIKEEEKRIEEERKYNEFLEKERLH